jgi:steroid delta-isomerase-like uncharacterized protein
MRISIGRPTNVVHVVDGAFARDFAERWVAAWNSHDAQRILDLCTPDIVWIDPALPEPSRGREEARTFIDSTWRAFPDLVFTPVGEPYVQLEGHDAALLWDVTGTMTGPMEPPGFAPTGARIKGRGMDLYGFEGELLAEYTTVYDLSAWMRVMGLLPEPGSRFEKVGTFAPDGRAAGTPRAGDMRGVAK